MNWSVVTDYLKEKNKMNSVIEKAKANDKIVDDLFDEIETIILSRKSKTVYQINNLFVDA